jgi:hypothetical protein
MAHSKKHMIRKSARNAAWAVAVLAVVPALFYMPFIEPFGFRRATTGDLPRIGAILLLVGAVSFVVGLIPRGDSGAQNR